MNILVVIETMVKLFIILCLGYILNKAGIFDEYVNKKISALIVNLTSPLLVISSVCTIENSNRSLILILIGVSFVMYLCFILFGKLITRILPFPEHDRPVYECMCVFANTGFMGYPVIQSVLGVEAVFYTAILHLAFNFFVYTYAVVCLNRTGDEKGKFSPRQLLTPGMILCVAALAIYLLQIHLPDIVVSVAESVGSVTSPLSMMMIGSSLALYPLKDSISDWRSYLFSAVRLLVIPSLTALVCTLLKVDSYYAAIAIITNGMPVASMVLMLATQYNANKEVVTRNIVVSTLLSVITIPVIVSLYVL